MSAPPRHLVREWNRWPDLFILPCTMELAEFLAEQLCRGHCPKPTIQQGRAQEESICVWTGRKDRPCVIRMRAGFTVGELCHELAHAHLFARIGNHNHLTPRERHTIQMDEWATVRAVPVFERTMDMVCAGALCFDCGDRVADALLDAQGLSA